jgi:hypothetical protein
MLRMVRLARASAVTSRTQAVNQLKAVLVGADPALRESVSGLTGAALVRACASLPAAQPVARNAVTGGPDREIGVPTAALLLSQLARRHRHLIGRGSTGLRVLSGTVHAERRRLSAAGSLTGRANALRTPISGRAAGIVTVTPAFILIFLAGALFWAADPAHRAQPHRLAQCAAGAARAGRRCSVRSGTS